ncbi:TOG array regulator of axonemal microtubules protein 1 [Octodon degus]|uniref:TOG array regulator of axonemal microtubules protein 1 n=1 Tax=Octodon degus TaxID=10160 RepID=A0A6P6F4B4_OCTDE|nr:TOG array regulator of axonemal microtubules protein 1 [Octodon degus]
MAAAPSALPPVPPFVAPCAYRPPSHSRPPAPETDVRRAAGTMRGEKSYYCRGVAGDHGSYPSTPSPLPSTLLLPAEAASSSWSGPGGALSGGDEEETRLLQLLRAAPDPSEALQALQAALPRRGGRLGLPRRKEALYRALGRVLVEGGSDEKRLCLQLLLDVLRGQGDAGQLEEAFSLALLPQLVVSLREEDPAVRKDALQILHICLKRSSGQVLRALIQQGLESADAQLRASTALLLPVLLTPEDLLLGLDLTEVIIALARKLGDQEIEDESETAFSALEQIGERLGQERFHSYISRLPSALRRLYNRRLETHLGSQVPYYLELETSGFPDEPVPCVVTLSNSNLKFGIIPQELHSRLLDQEDYKNRTQAVEELKQVLGKFNPSSTTHSSLVGFISLLYNLLDDSNFKVVLGALQVLHLLVIRLGEQVQQFLGPVVTASVKVLADNKLVIKQEYMKIFLKLMKEVGPQQVLCLLLEHLKHKHSRVREEVVNICICSLLTYPSEDFDLPKLSFDLAPALVDTKRRVRQAALEAFAVLASSMGSGKTNILFKAVDTIEMQDNGDGVMNAVQARLARKTLPRLTEKGFVEYAILMPSSAQSRSSHLAHGADTDWLLAGNRNQSAHCHCGEPTRDSMQMYGSYSPTICTRRVLSAGKGKNKLPWENEQPGVMEENPTSSSKDIEQFSSYDLIPSPKLKSSQGMPASDDLCFSRKRVSRNLLQNSRDLHPDSLPVCATGTAGTRKTNLPGKCGQLGLSHTRGKTGSVDSNLELLGTTSSHQDKEESQRCYYLAQGGKMQSSLRSLRNSAAKKRAKLSGSTSDIESPDSAMKLDLTMDSPSRSSSPNISSYSESGVYSQESLTSSVSTTPQGKRIMSDIFPACGSKLSPARFSSTKNKSSHTAEPSINAGITTSNVSIIGQRMNYGFGNGDFEDDTSHDTSPSTFKIQHKEHSRHYKHTKGFTRSSSNVQQISNFDFTSTNTLSEDSVVVVGKGVFGNPNSAPATCSQPVVPAVENGDTFSVKQSIEPPSGIYGRAVQQSVPSYLDVENDKNTKVAMSKSTYDKMRQKRKEEKELFDVKDCEKKEQNPWERMKHIGTEKTISESDAPPGAGPQPKERLSSVTHSLDVMDSLELRPFSKPEVALTEALRLLADEDWEKKIEGLNFIRCLAAFHSEILNTKLHEANFAVVQEVKNLRSGVSRAAVVCLSDLFTYLKKSMDQELDATVKVLLHKAGESNTFIREDVDKALSAMANNVTPARAASALINGGQSHLHIAVRRCTAQHLANVVEFMEPDRILTGTKDMAERLLPAAAKFAQDSSQETRYYGRKMLFLMMCHPNFEKLLEKYVPSKDLPYIKESLKNLRQKGLGEMPPDPPSAKGRRSHAGSVGNARASSVSRDAFGSAEREVTEAREVTRKPVPRNSLESAEYVKVLTGLLNAKDFRDRISGIKQLLADAENNQELVVGNIVKIFDAFKSRLHDSNSKVNLVALESMHKMIPLLRDHLSPIINMLIPAIVDNNLNSKNPGIYAAATNVVQALSQHVDNYLLLQPFCTKAQFLNGKAKQDMTEKLADIVMELHQRKPHATEQKVLVVLWHLLGNMTNSGSLPGAGGNIRTATAKLSKALFAQMGQNLLHQAASQPPHIKKSLEELLDMTILNEL